MVWVEAPDGSRRLASYEEVDGYAITEGDIVLGTIDEIAGPVGEDGLVDKGAAIVAAGSAWNNGVVYYSTASFANLPSGQSTRVLEAMRIWTDATQVTFVGCPGRIPYNPATGAYVPDYIAFRPSSTDISSSALGRTGGQQWLTLTSVATLKTIVHELGHAMGLIHEHSRLDRDTYVEVFEENIRSERLDDHETWLQQNIQGGDITGHTTCGIPPYNFDSVMHYGSFDGDDADWPAMLRYGEATMNGVEKKLYKWDALYTWLPLQTSDFSNAQLGYGLFNSDARTDIFHSNGSTWFYSANGTGSWTQINSSSYRYRKARTTTTLLLGDYDGNGRTDALREGSGRWYVSYNGSGGWTVVNSDARLNGTILQPRHLATGDFDGDYRTDVLAESGGNWWVRYGAAGAWQLYADNTDNMPPVWEVSYGDFNGDHITDPFRVSGDGAWQIYWPDWIFPWVGTWENYKTGQAARGPLYQNATAGSFSNSIALGDFTGDGLTDVLSTFDGSIFHSVTGLDGWGWPVPGALSPLLGKTLTPLHFDNFNMSFVHTCKTLSAGGYSGQRRCHAGADTNGDGITELISSQAAPVEPPGGTPTLSRGDIWALCSRYPGLGGKCASGGMWTAATCPVDVE